MQRSKVRLLLVNSQEVYILALVLTSGNTKLSLLLVFKCVNEMFSAEVIYVIKEDVHVLHI